MVWYEIQKVVALQLHNARWAFKIATVYYTLEYAVWYM